MVPFEAIEISFPEEHKKDGDNDLIDLEIEEVGFN